MQVLIMGREQNLSMAEIEAVVGNVKLLNNQAVAVTQPEPVNIERLGGTIKTGREVSKLTEYQPEQVIDICLKYIVSKRPKSKFNFGFSYYGAGRPNLLKLGINLKRQLQRLGLKPRLVESKNNTINAASIKHNSLIDGYEFLLVENSLSLVIARTTAAQDVDKYSKRDYGKPCRNSKVGMLPPKLSQILINLSRPTKTTIIVDPFCGSGGLLFESSLLGYNSEGTDIDPEMVKCSQQNVDWFEQNFTSISRIEIGPAVDAAQRSYPNATYNVVSEGFLGDNFSSPPSKLQILNNKSMLEKLYIKFFKHLASQATKPGVVCICAPFWLVNNKAITLDVIDDITKLGYTKSEFKSVQTEDLIHFRQGQFTGRQILIFNTN